MKIKLIAMLCGLFAIFFAAMSFALYHENSSHMSSSSFMSFCLSAAAVVVVYWCGTMDTSEDERR